VEAVFRDEIVQHLDKCALIRNTWHGFRKGYSCTSNLLVFLESVTTDIDAGGNVDTVYLDLAKAFDKVPHQRLLIKLKAHGIDGLVCNWIKRWLSCQPRRCIFKLETGVERSPTGIGVRTNTFSYIY